MFWVWGIYDLFRGGLIQMLIEGPLQGKNADAALIGGGLLLCLILPYLLGSVNFALVASRLFFHDDVRSHGSGNAGMTNVLRTYGKKAAVFTFLGDGLKGILSVLLACLIFGNILYFDVLAAYLAALFCALGHVFPCFSQFHGGKGFATSVCCILVLNPVIFAILLAVFLTLVIGTRYVSLGSVVVMMFYPVILFSFDNVYTGYGVNVLIAFLMAALVVWCHRGNLQRIMNRTERKLSFGSKPAVEQKEQSEEENV